MKGIPIKYMDLQKLLKEIHPTGGVVLTKEIIAIIAEKDDPDNLVIYMKQNWKELLTEIIKKESKE